MLQAGIKDPREEMSMMEEHDCFSFSELAATEDPHISEPGNAPDDTVNGFFDLDGRITCQPDGGLSSPPLD